MTRPNRLTAVTARTLQADQRRRRVVELASNGMNLADIAAELQISRRRAEQLWNEAIRELRQRLVVEDVDFEL